MINTIKNNKMKSIKTFAAIVFAALTLSLVGCSEDVEDLIVGKWNVESVTVTDVYTNHPDPSMNGTHTETEYVPEGYSMTFTFNKDKTVEVQQSSGNITETASGTYSVDGMKLTITLPQSYRDDGGQIHNSTYSETVEIVNIDKKNLTLRMEVYDEVHVYDGVTYNYTGYSDYNMKRI